MKPSYCFNFREAHGWSRREVLRVGSLSLLGLTLPELLAAPAPAQGDQGPAFGRAKACILLFMWGGPAHQDTFDLKPEAPVEVRGPRGAVPFGHAPGVAGEAEGERAVRRAGRVAPAAGVGDVARSEIPGG